MNLNLAKNMNFVALRNHCHYHNNNKKKYTGRSAHMGNTHEMRRAKKQISFPAQNFFALFKHARIYPLLFHDTTLARREATDRTHGGKICIANE